MLWRGSDGQMDAEEITLREEVALMPQELAYGVTSIQTDGDLTLMITTLEGETLRISASVAGYRVRRPPGAIAW